MERSEESSKELQAYLVAGNAYGEAFNEMHAQFEAIERSDFNRRSELVAALRSSPEHVKLIGLPSGTGILPTAEHAPLATFDVTRLQNSGELAEAILAYNQTKQKVRRAHERLPQAAQSTNSPDDFIASRG